jgi:multiple sugar transport system substrate-binding protein
VGAPVEFLFAVVLFVGLVLGIEVVLNGRRPTAVLSGWAKRGAAAIAIVVGLAFVASAAEPVLRPSPTVTVGSNNQGEPSESAFLMMVSACEGRTEVIAKVNVYEPNQFQDTIDAYLRGKPDDVFTWFSGERMRFYAAQGLVTPVSDLWTGFGGHYSEAVKEGSTGDDGQQYLVPGLRYPWVVLYRRSLFERNGYAVPETLDDLVTLARQMQADGLIPFAFADAEGWPAMGIFDILDMRLNGYQFHQDLLAGRERWTDPRAEAVFRLWADLAPYFQEGALERNYQDAARAMLDGRAGMMYFATFLGEVATDPAVHDDLDMFPFPLLGNAWDGERAIDAPLDGYMLRRSPTNLADAKRLAYCLAGGSAQFAYLWGNPNAIAAAADASSAASTSFTGFQKRIQEVLRDSGAIAQFLDRDTRPDFAGPDGMRAFLRDFLRDPGQDPAGLQARIQAFYDGLP